MAREVETMSRSSVSRAGDLLTNPDADETAVERALDVLSAWRSMHALPLNTIYMDLRVKVNRVRADAITVQRLKRARSIVAKLRREKGMKLARMQDIGGCRAVVHSVAEVDEVRKLYAASRARHEFVKEDDYIRRPQTSGYRSLHLIYRFNSRSKPEFNKLQFEIQLRTQLQHAWATAVETVGAVLGQALKASEGEDKWLEFFRYAAAAFAYIEKCEPVPSLPVSPRVLARALQSRFTALAVREKLDAYRTALKRTEDLDARKAAYFLLVLRPEARSLQIISFSSRSRESAYREYLRYEKQLPLFPRSKQLSLFSALDDYSEAQAVLVGADSLKSLRTSYPNYYLDTETFLAELDAFIGAYGKPVR